jgi:hypothetical protein
MDEATIAWLRTPHNAPSASRDPITASPTPAPPVTAAADAVADAAAADDEHDGDKDDDREDVADDVGTRFNKATDELDSGNEIAF